MVEFSGAPAVGITIDVASGVLFLLLAAAVIRVRPRRPANWAFCAFAASFGIVFVLLNLGPDYLGLLGPGATNAQSLANLVWAASLSALATLAPRPIRWRDRFAIAFAGAVAAATALLAIASTWSAAAAGTLDGGLVGWPRRAYVASDALGYASIAFLLLAVAARKAPGTPLARRGSNLLILAFLPYYGLLFGAIGVLSVQGSDGPLQLAGNVAYLAVLPLVGVVWLARRWRGRRRDGPMYYAIPAAAALFPTLGAIWAAVAGHSVYASGVLGACRLIGVVMLTYGILRVQLFDIDIRLKTTLRGSTVAGAFIAIFFIVSEMAQQVFSDRVGPYLGIAAAGLLVLAISPLQRAAQRLADAAMPSVLAGNASYVERSKRETYKEAYLAAWGDGALTRKEAQLLSKVRDALALTPREYYAIEKETRREAGDP